MMSWCNDTAACTSNRVYVEVFILMILFSKSNSMFLGNFDPEQTVVDKINNQFFEVTLSMH